MNEQIGVVLVDDHGLCRRGLKELLELRVNMRVLGTTGDPDEAVEFARELAPDLMVMDLRMPAMDGISLLRRLRNEGFELPVVILTMSDSQEDLADALRAGARGYLLKDMDPDDVIASIHRVAQGEMWWRRRCRRSWRSCCRAATARSRARSRSSSPRASRRSCSTWPAARATRRSPGR